MNNKIAAAFVKAQTAFAPAIKSSENSHFKNKYADLAACVEAVIDALNANGIALVQVTHEVEVGVTVETLFLHESGETMSGGKLHVPAAKQDPQAYGSALTYARRYSLMAACGIAPEDDDGNAASAPKAAERPAAKPAPAAPPAKAEPAKTQPMTIERMKKGIAAGKAADVAKYLAGMADKPRAVWWDQLTEEEQEAVSIAWPEEEGAHA